MSELVSVSDCESVYIFVDGTHLFHIHTYIHTYIGHVA